MPLQDWRTLDDCHATGQGAIPKPAGAHDRQVRSGRNLSTRLRHRPLRFPLHLLHVGKHELSAEKGYSVAGGTRPAMFRLCGQGCPKTTTDRRRTAGAQEHHASGALDRPPYRNRPSRRTDAHHQWLAARPLLAGTVRCWRAPYQRLTRYARSAEIQENHPLGQFLQGHGRH
ncbi:hypothetical protein D3C71_1469120 [compost metagenome]